MILCLERAYGQAVRVGAPQVGLRRFGVPPGGAFDRESRALALALIGADAGEPVWEVAGGAELVATQDIRVSCVGAPVVVSVNGREHPANAVWPVREGEVIRVLGSREAARVYLAAKTGAGPEARLAHGPDSLRKGRIAVLPGPQASAGLTTLLEGRWQVALQSDRVGLRLTGGSEARVPELPSEPSCVGAIQLTPSGTPLIIGPDGPTIGGYPKVAVVAECDLDRIGQLPPGAEIDFKELTFAEAAALRREWATRLARKIAELAAFAQDGHK